MCPSAAPTNATLPLSGAAPASSAGFPVVPGRRPSRNLKAAREMNRARHERRDPKLRPWTECPECWGSNGREALTDRSLLLKPRCCDACRDFKSERIDATTWNQRVLRLGDRRLT